MAQMQQILKELKLDRMFEASPEQMFKAWTEERHVRRWWGPDGFTNPVCEVDARPGGSIWIHMRGSDGAIYRMTGVFQEISKPSMLVFTLKTFAGRDVEPLMEGITMVRFSPYGSRTKLALTARVFRARPDASIAMDGMDQGWNEQLDRLADHLSGG
jgi:uncharacterized protein YndB with AHSA1/START domain